MAEEQPFSGRGSIDGNNQGSCISNEKEIIISPREIIAQALSVDEKKEKQKNELVKM